LRVAKANPEREGVMVEMEFGAYVGLDWGDQAHTAAVWDVGAQRRTEKRIEHTPAALHEWVAQLRSIGHGGRVAVAIEQSRGAVFDALSGYDFLTLYPINPRSAARYREAFRPSNAKDDPTDADSLLEMLRKHGESLRPFVADDACTRSLRLLTEDRRELVDQRTAHVQRLTDRLKAYFPQALTWAGGLTSVQACEFLEHWPTLDAIKRARPSTVRAFYRQHRHSEASIDQTLKAVRSAMDLHRDQPIITAAVMMVHSEVAQIRALTASITEYERQIAATFADHPDAPIFASFPGAGAQLAPRLAAAFGTNRDRYAGAVDMSTLSGIAPVLRRSGKSVIVQMRWACPKFMRQTFHEFARVSIGQSAWARAFYHQQRKRGHSRHQAIRTLAYRWIRVLHACWKNRTAYDEKKYLQQLARRGSPLAALAA
jgi:transposase